MYDTVTSLAAATTSKCCHLSAYSCMSRAIDEEQRHLPRRWMYFFARCTTRTRVFFIFKLHPPGEEHFFNGELMQHALVL